MEYFVWVSTVNLEEYVDRVNWCQHTLKEGQYKVAYNESKIYFEDGWAKTIFLLRWS